MTAADVLHKIESMQIASDPFYNNGLFPVQRTWNLSNEPVEDNTIFFTASIVQTLNQLSIDPDSRRIIATINTKAIKNYSKYKSRNGEPTFNFWQTSDPDLPFPHGNRWISNPKMRLPDDLDTSVILAMSSENDEIKSQLREKMITYSARNGRDESELRTLKEYETSKAYEVWFAKEMPQTFDICVMANTMLFVLNENYQFTEFDNATIELIKEMVLANDYVEQVDQVSHHTTSAAVILYHVARMIEADTEGIFDSIKPKVIDDLVVAFNTSENEMEKMLAQTSILRLDGYPVGVIDHEKIHSEIEEYAIFKVKPFLGNPQLSFLNAVVPDIRWKCEAYNWTLYLEYLQLNKTYLSNLSGSH